MNKTALCGILLCLAGSACADTGGRLLATGGVTNIEGSAGGGIVPWAVLSGYGTRDEWGGDAFATRVDKAKAKAILLQIPDARYAEVARILHKEVSPIEAQGQGEIGVICAGTSDLPVAEEAAVVAELLGNKVRRITDVGVAGVHRLLRHADALQSCRVLVWWPAWRAPCPRW